MAAALFRTREVLVSSPKAEVILRELVHDQPLLRLPEELAAHPIDVGARGRTRPDARRAVHRGVSRKSRGEQHTISFWRELGPRVARRFYPPAENYYLTEGGDDSIY